MLYFDTSFLALLALLEAMSESVTIFFRELPAEHLDKTMLRAGKSLGLPTSAGIRVQGYEG